MRYVGRQQPFNHGQKKIAIAEGRLEDSELVEGQILRVASQIENELDYFATRENRASVLRVASGQSFDGVRKVDDRQQSLSCHWSLGFV